MTNKFRIGEVVYVSGKGKETEKLIEGIAIIECKEYFFNEYLVTMLSTNIKDWVDEKDIIRLMDRKFKKQDKYKVALAIDKRGLDIIKQRLNMSSKKNNNILKKLTYSKEFRAFKKDYAILIWASTYWSENNFVVRIIEETLGSLREKNIAYKLIVIGENDNTYIKIKEFIDNDSNVDVFNVIQKIELKDFGGVII